MRGLWIVFSLAPFTNPADGWTGADKAQHFFTSAFVQSVGYSTLRAANAGHTQSIIGASIATAAVGVGKEIHDSKAGRPFSFRDLAWDAAGAAAATALLVNTRR